MTNHCSHENPGVKRSPIILNPSDTSIPKLPDSYVIQPPVELAQTDVFAPRFGLNEFRPLVDLRGAKVKDEAWLVHVANAMKQSASADDDVITWAGYNSLLANDVSVKPPAVIGVYPLFPDKTASASSMKHAMELTM